VPLAIGAALIAAICGGWVAGDVDFAIYPLLGAPILGWLARREGSDFFLTASVTALCLMLWAVARNDLRRPDDRVGSGAPAELKPR
jgi:hypothetical protein